MSGSPNLYELALKALDDLPAGPSRAGAPTLIAGRYRVVRVLARGGTSTLFAATDLQLPRNVAIKLLDPRVAQLDERAAPRFEREAEALGRLRHPNIVTVYDAGTQDGSPWLALELLEGETLRDRLRRGPLPREEALRIAGELARGLSAVHAEGLVHRDLKPENVFLQLRGPVKLLDFGLVKQAPSSPTPLAVPIAGAGYLSPEQLRGEAVDARSDVFAFGLIVHELFAGQHPFQRGTAVETSYAVLAQPPAVLPRSAPRDLVLRCLAKQPEDRPASMDEVVTALASTRSWKPYLAGGAAALAAVACAVAAFALRGGASPAAPPRTLVVAPFTVHGPEAAALHEGMVDLLSPALAGAGPRVIDAHAVIAAHEQDPAALARKLGARFVVTGTAVAAGGRVQVQAELLEEGRDAPLATARADAPPDRLFRVVDDLADALRPALRAADGAPPGPVGRAVRLAALTSSSQPALEAYLRGESALRRGNFRRAIEALKEATAADPSFALAHFRLARAAAFRDPALAHHELDEALRHAERLGEHDRELMRAFEDLRAGRWEASELRLAQLVASTPDDVDAWFTLGELRFHFDPLTGRPRTRAIEAFDRTLLLDPQHGAALLHRIDLAQMDGDVALILALSDRYLQQDDVGYAVPVRWTRAAAAHDLVAEAQLLSDFARPSDTEGPETIFRAAWDDDGLAGAEAVARAAVKAHPADAELCERLATVLFGRGKLREGKALLEGLRGASWRFAFNESWLLSIDFYPATREELRAAQARVLTLEADSPVLPPLRGFGAGALALRLGEPVEPFIRALEGLPRGELTGTMGADLARDLRARQAHSLAPLERMELEVPYKVANNLGHLPDPLLRARLLARAGRPAEALAWLDARSYYDRYLPAWMPPTLWARAELLEKSDPPQASRLWKQFARMWAEADPELRPRVDEALRRAAGQMTAAR